MYTSMLLPLAPKKLQIMFHSAARTLLVWQKKILENNVFRHIMDEAGRDSEVFSLP